MNKLFGILRQNFGIFVRQRDVRAEFVRSNLRDRIRKQARQGKKVICYSLHMDRIPFYTIFGN